MPTQTSTADCDQLYRQGKYAPLLELVKNEAEKRPASEAAAMYLAAAQVERERLNVAETKAYLEKAVTAARESGAEGIELTATLILNTVRAEKAKTRSQARDIVKESESLLSRVRKLRSPDDAASESLFIAALCEIGLTKIYATEVALAGQNLRQASGAAEEKFGSESQQMIMPSLYLAILHGVEGKHTLAQAMARNAVKLVRANYGKHPLVLQPLYRLAQALTRQGLLHQSIDVCRDVEGVIIDNIGENNDVYIDVLGMKTASFMFMIEYEAAEKTARKRLRLAEKRRGKNDPRLIDPLCDLAQSLASLGKREEAAEHFERALELVSELGRNQGFPEAGSENAGDIDVVTGAPDAVPVGGESAGSRIGGDSICHLEYSLTEQLSDCYLWQGKLADAARLMPASMRARHICRVDNIVSIIDTVNRYLVERARRLDLPS